VKNILLSVFLFCSNCPKSDWCEKTCRKDNLLF